MFIEALGGGGIFAVALLYFGAFNFAGQSFWHNPGWEVVGGVLHTAALGMIPLASYGLLKFLGRWDESLSFHSLFEQVQSQFVFLELSTILVGCGIVYFVRFSFLVAPIAMSLWFLSVRYIFGSNLLLLELNLTIIHVSDGYKSHDLQRETYDETARRSIHRFWSLCIGHGILGRLCSRTHGLFVLALLIWMPSIFWRIRPARASSLFGTLCIPLCLICASLTLFCSFIRTLKQL